MLTVAGDAVTPAGCSLTAGDRPTWGLGLTTRREGHRVLLKSPPQVALEFWREARPDMRSPRHHLPPSRVACRGPPLVRNSPRAKTLQFQSWHAVASPQRGCHYAVVPCALSTARQKVAPKVWRRMCPSTLGVDGGWLSGLLGDAVIGRLTSPIGLPIRVLDGQSARVLLGVPTRGPPEGGGGGGGPGEGGGRGGMRLNV